MTNTAATQRGAPTDEREAIEQHIRNVYVGQGVLGLTALCRQLLTERAALASAAPAPRELTQAEHQVLRAAAMSASTLVAKGKLVEAPAPELGGHAQQWVRDLLFSAFFCGSSNFHQGEVRRLLAPNSDIAEEVIARAEHKQSEWEAKIAPAPTGQPSGWLLTAIMEKFEQLPSWDRSYRSAMEHDLRSILALASPVAPEAAPVEGDWSIDNSTESPILTYKNCSVIQDEQAHWLLGLIRAVAAPRAPGAEPAATAQAAEAMEYEFACYSCAHEWTGQHPEDDCPTCGTTNNFCAENVGPAEPAVAGLADYLESQEFHERCMDYRGANGAHAQDAFERLQESIEGAVLAAQARKDGK